MNQAEIIRNLKSSILKKLEEKRYRMPIVNELIDEPEKHDVVKWSDIQEALK